MFESPSAYVQPNKDLPGMVDLRSCPETWKPIPSEDLSEECSINRCEFTTPGNMAPTGVANSLSTFCNQIVCTTLDLPSSRSPSLSTVG